METQRIEPEAGLGVVVAPYVVTDITKRLQRRVITRGVSAIDQHLRDLLWLGDTKVGSFQNRAQHALGCHRISANEFRASPQHATVIIRPWAVRNAAGDNMADVAGAHFLEPWRKGQECVDLTIGEKLRDRFALDP